MSLYTFLPLFEGWKYEPKDIDVPVLIKAGEEYLVHETKYPGWLMWVIGSVNNPDAEIVVKYWYLGMTYEGTIRVRALYELGLTSPNNVGAFTPRYDDVNKVYVVAYFPTVFPGFTDKCELWLRAPKTAPVTLLNYASLIISIVNKEKFIKSLQRVLGVPITVERFRELMRVAPAPIPAIT